MPGTGTVRIKLTRDLLITSPPWGLPGGVRLEKGMEYTVGEDTAEKMKAAQECEILGPGVPDTPEGATNPDLIDDGSEEEVVDPVTGTRRLQTRKRK